MNFNHLLFTSKLQQEKLLEYGFKQNGNFLLLKKSLDKDFYALITFDTENLTAEVFEKESDEKYTLIDVKTAYGAFVNDIRTKVTDLLDDIHKKCFVSSDIKSLYVRWLEDELHTKGDYPWKDDDTSSVYRCQNQKWFALVMKINFKNLGFESDAPVWAVNLKTDAEKIPQIIDKKSIFPAWHMNKKYWITVVLSSVTDFNQLKQLILRSKELVE